MTTQYTRSVLKMVVAQICQTVGWHSINSTPLEFMVDLMQEYIFQLSKLTQDYAQVLGRSDANLDDLGLAFQHMNINLQELAEYVKNVDSVPCAIAVPKLPIHKENHLNFLKPGSREVVSRPVHVHEHLPAMYPGTEEEYAEETKPTEVANTTSLNESTNSFDDDSNEVNNEVTTNGIVTEESPNKVSSQAVFKRPGDPISFDGPVLKRAKTIEEGRPLREIRSVIMTTSGFLSTAREGKLPEARTPQQARSESSPPPSYPMVPPEIKVEKKIKKIPKKSTVSQDGKPENKENKKKKIPKDTLFQPDEIKEVKVKKTAGSKDIAKMKTIKPGNKVVSSNIAGPSNPITGVKMQGKVPSGNPNPKQVKNIIPNNKTKMEKMDITQNLDNNFLIDHKEEVVDKLPIEPPKGKLNIFKKISSKPKEDKEREPVDSFHRVKELSSCENSSNLISDENDKYRNDLVVKQEDKKSIVQGSIVNSNIVRTSGTEDNIANMMSPGSGSDVYMFDMSPPGTPSTPKTPELSVINVSTEPKKKKKDKSGKKKDSKPKTPRSSVSPKKARLSSDSGEVNVLDRPKTPQAPEPPVSRDSNLSQTRPFPFFSFPTSPGLIPHPMFPLPMHKGLPGIIGAPNPAVMPNMLCHRFTRPNLDGSRPLVPPSFVGENLQSTSSSTFAVKPSQQQVPLKTPDVEVIPKTEPPSNFAHFPTKVPTTPTPLVNITAGIPSPLVATTSVSPAVPAPLLPPNVPPIKPFKSEKPEKSDKKSKEHKKDKKEKLKKKKDKKDKHKEKGEKIKEKKDKSEKKEKLDKIKEKKEKKEKRKEKEAIKKLKEEKAESVPKITLKLGPAGGSPRPPTPDSAVMKKITIKPPKKPEEEMKREPTPELARISALVTRPPKQKSTSKKAEERLLEAYTAAPTEASFSSSSLTPIPRTKKPIFKTLPERNLSPVPALTTPISSFQSLDSTEYCFVAKAEAVPKKEDTKEDKENGGNALTTKPVTVDPSGRKVWICPGCGKQDDGSPMIGCDDCDAWYHWVCVGIHVAPAEDENWYCGSCLARKDQKYHDKKKKKRKKKVKLNA